MATDVETTILGMTVRVVAAHIEIRLKTQVRGGVEILADMASARVDLGVEIHRFRAAGGKSIANTVIEVRVGIEVVATSEKRRKRIVITAVAIVIIRRLTTMKGMKVSIKHRTERGRSDSR